MFTNLYFIIFFWNFSRIYPPLLSGNHATWVHLLSPNSPPSSCLWAVSPLLLPGRKCSSWLWSIRTLSSPQDLAGKSAPLGCCPSHCRPVYALSPCDICGRHLSWGLGATAWVDFLDSAGLPVLMPSLCLHRTFSQQGMWVELTTENCHPLTPRN